MKPIIFFEKDQFEEAVNAYQYIVDNHPRHRLYPMALFNLGLSYYNSKKLDKAKSVFKTVLASNFNEEQPVGGSIMDDPYANYKHRSSMNLYRIYNEQGKGDSAFYYLALADTVYPYLHFCGNEQDANDIMFAVSYAKLFLESGDKEKALDKLLAASFTSLSSNEDVIEMIGNILVDQNRKGLKEQLNTAIEHIANKEMVQNGDTFQYYFLNFLGREIALDWHRIYDDEEEKSEHQQMQEYVRSSALFRKIHEIDQ